MLTEQSLRKAFAERLPGLAEALDVMLTRGHAREPGGIVLLQDGSVEAVARAYSEATGRAASVALAQIRASIRAWHGSPHRFDRFSLEAIGTGEGAQAYGWGLYFADSREVAEFYREQLGSGLRGWNYAAEARALGIENFEAFRAAFHAHARSEVDTGIAARRIHNASIEARKVDGLTLSKLVEAYREQARGALYEASIAPSEDMFLLWDKPLNEQSATVRSALMRLDWLDPSVFAAYTGQQLYEAQVRDGSMFEGKTIAQARRDVSAAMLAAGIQGIKYLDGVSRDVPAPRVVREGEQFVVYWGNDPSPVDAFLTQEEADAAAAEIDARHYNYVVFDAEDVDIIDVRFSRDGIIQGFYDSGSALTFLVGPNLDERRAVPVVLHEVVHAHQDPELEEQALALIEGRDHEQETLRAFLSRVARRIERARTEDPRQEAMPYIVEQAMLEGRQAGHSSVDGRFMTWVDRVIGQKVGAIVRSAVARVRAWAHNHGLPVKRLYVDDMVAIAQGWMRRTLRPEIAQREPSQAASEKGSWYYSALRRAVAAARPERMPAAQWKAWIEANAPKLRVKAEEISWSGVIDWLDLQGEGRVERSELLKYLDHSNIEIREVEKSEANARARVFNQYRERLQAQLNTIAQFDLPQSVREAAKAEYDRLIEERDGLAARESLDDVPKYATYRLPGGENYRELLLTLPVKGDSAPPENLYRTGSDIRAKASLLIDGGFSEDAVEQAARFTDEAGSVRDGLARQDRLVASGFGYTPAQKEAGAILRAILTGQEQRVAAFEENLRKNTFQSKHWKESNVVAHIRLDDRTDADGRRVLFVQEIQSDWGQEGREKGFALSAEERVEMERLNEFTSVRGRPRTQAENARLDELARRNTGPDAGPFVTETKSWVNLALKRIVALAAEEGYERVAFITGEQASQIFQLDKVIDEVGFNGSTLKAFDIDGEQVLRCEVTESALPEYIGKEATQRLLQQEPSNGGWKVLRGQDLKVGQKGLRVFYDQIVLQQAKDILRRFEGGSIGSITLDVPGRGSSRQPCFDITPGLRHEVLATGLPLFSFAGQSAIGADHRALGSAQRRFVVFDTADPYQQYRALAGEIEARNVQVRQHMTDAERRATAPQDTADVAEQDMILKPGRPRRSSAPSM